MQPVSDIVVLDFCEWLSNAIRKNTVDPESVLDLL